MIIKSSIRNYEVVFSKTKLDDDYYLVDKNVYDLYKERLNIPDEKTLVIEANEQSKSFQNCSNVIEQLISLGVKRGKTLGVIGGGVLQDLGGFLCSVMFRGLSWNFYPTTLLAQCDSCIGGKTSINFKSYKNILGTFNPPGKINIDTNFLCTLKEEEIQSGIGEVVKISFLDSKQRIDFKDVKKAIECSTVPLELIKTALEIKKEIIEIDEFDKGLRNIMNLGHTFGHAIESISNFKIPHGIAVVFGIKIAHELSKIIYKVKNKDEVIDSFLSKNKVYLDVFKECFCIENYLNALTKDKKNMNLDDICCIMEIENGSFNKVNIEKNKLKLYINEIVKNI